MLCPHCLVTIFAKPCDISLGWDRDFNWWIRTFLCPSCSSYVIHLVKQPLGPEIPRAQAGAQVPAPLNAVSSLIHPKATNRQPVSGEVPEEFTADYREACLVLADSPKASAALSRRCLQHILQEKSDAKTQNDLAKTIGEVIDDPKTPRDVADSLDMVRNIGNFSAHPNKSTNTGEIVPVEPVEAEWCLDVIEMLFDLYFVRPSEIQRRRDRVDEKLADTGKPPNRPLPPSSISSSPSST